MAKMKVLEKIKRFSEQRRAMRELSALDDHVLRDLGISRSHIPFAVKGARGN
ncbi:hypothetical protein RTCIAT899_PC02460 (plasmid) [Rhizobium tropici CIAT 899]|uniref:Uncharacterized protein YjiS (DUF1127 family) n=3 Tax=Rhizobium TaxID=379 RepID=A0ABU1SU44_9HYPH|nr:hypothetical protein RTCIAT899_PC02460 [Rhizobium tropici CIAT 899]MBB3384072.1 uncharacterized protein YjiS (DUF1127 family) [Rhizobium sp. BK098]MBB3425842.1 uncharacterized protein YjiS (DUF1127 family) [Rhizobium sp. BK312]MBB3569170.1 uncharacterized protein YjiS (DUF1127 family) [Rhizobium sp. BK491]MBB3615772.1 uncharacterized protein YjiS (DUF1127 family) [Rhizobium sp. BK609]MBB3681431.1 uncharacterized protein YjiS (DUF1127 family) [Rhizobium sp. BK612]MBB4240780.1 uncharacterize